MQVDPMQDDIGIFESLFERGSGRNTHDHAAVDGVEHGDRIRDDRLLEHGLTDAETIEHMKYVGAELDAVTDCTKFRCFFENLDRPSLSANCKGGCKAADTAAYNQDGRAFGHHANDSGRLFGSRNQLQ